MNLNHLRFWERVGFVVSSIVAILWLMLITFLTYELNIGDISEPKDLMPFINLTLASTITTMAPYFFFKAVQWIADSLGVKA